MGKNYKILGIVFGSYSGVRENLFARLAKKHEVILPVLKLGRLYRYYSHLNSYIRTTIALHNLPSHPNQWRQLTDKNKWRWLKETELCEQEVKRQKDNVDFVLQIGSKHGGLQERSYSTLCCLYRWYKFTYRKGRPFLQAVAVRSRKSSKNKVGN